MTTILTHYDKSSDATITEMLSDFKHEVQSLRSGSGQFKSALTLYLDK